MRFCCRVPLPVARVIPSCAATLACFLLTGQSAFAQRTDVTFGGDARAYAMGGAGVAVLQDNGGGARLNPATIAFEKRFFDYRFPTIALRGSEGVSLGRAYDYFANGKLQSVKSINDLARDFSNVDPKFGLNANTTVRFGMIEIGAGAVARGELQTNDALKKFVNSGIGGPVAANAADARADIIGAGYYTLPSIAAGIALPNKKDTRNTYAVGLRVKVMRAIYSHYIADATALDGQSNSLAAPELGDRDYLSKTGVGADLGIMMRPKAGSSGALSYALVIANAVRPKFDFDGTNKDDKATRVKLLSTTATAGIGYQKRGITLVGDIVDFTSSAGRADVRLGAEFVFPLNLAVRAGYAAGYGFTYGGSVFGFNVALGARQPLEIVRTIKF